MSLSQFRRLAVLASFTLLLFAALLVVSEDTPPTEEDPEYGSQAYFEDDNVAPSEQRHKEHENAIELLDKEEKIALYENEVQRIRNQVVRPAMSHAMSAHREYTIVKDNMPWFPSEGQKAQLAQAEANLGRAQKALVKAQEQEYAVVVKIKPLYGLVSRQFVEEQRSAIVSSIKTVNKMAYDQAWWSTILGGFRGRGGRDSLQDAIIGFFIEWLLMYVIMYPFAIGYYAFWTAPWSIMEYAGSSVTNVPLGIIMWVLSVFVMCLPLIALGVGLQMVGNRMGEERRDRHGL